MHWGYYDNPLQSTAQRSGHVQHPTFRIKSVTDLAIPVTRRRGKHRKTWSNVCRMMSENVACLALLYLHPVDLSDYMKYVSIPKLQWCNRWSLGMDKWFHRTLFWECDYLSLLGLQIIHVGKMGHREHWSQQRELQRSVPSLKLPIIYYSHSRKLSKVCLRESFPLFPPPESSPRDHSWAGSFSMD